MDEVLAHHTDECAGQWMLTGLGKQRSLRCSICTKQYIPTPETRAAALEENYAGIQLRRLSNQGESLVTVDLGDWRAGGSH